MRATHSRKTKKAQPLSPNYGLEPGERVRILPEDMTPNDGCYHEDYLNDERRAELSKTLLSLGDRLDFAELAFRATNADTFYLEMKKWRIAYKNCLERVEAAASCAIVESRLAGRKISASYVLKLRDRALAAAAHQVEVSKTPYLEVPQREVLDAAARDRLCTFKYNHMLAAYTVQREENEREHRKRRRAPIVDGYMQVGTKTQNGERVPVLRKVRGSRNDR